MCQQDANDKKPRKLAIRPMKDNKKGKLVCIPVSELLPGYEKSLEFSKAVVAYFDVMGFRTKNNQEEIEATLFDFAAPLRKTAEINDAIRFKIFSDCAFLAASIENAADLISAIRYAFEQWTFDGIFVRGGIALGTYIEFRDLIPQTKNFDWNFFAGSAVVEAVECERSGKGALLYATDDCATFLALRLGEPLFSLKEKKIIGWSDDISVLYYYLGCSLLRLLKVLSNKRPYSRGNKYIISNLLVNINYSLHATNPSLVQGIILAILSMPNLHKKARRRALKLLKIKDPNDFELAKNFIESFLKDEKRVNYLLALADLDSSLSGALISNKKP